MLPRFLILACVFAPSYESVACNPDWLGKYSRGFDNGGHAGDVDMEYLELACEQQRYVGKYSCVQTTAHSHGLVHFTDVVDIDLKGDILSVTLPTTLAQSCQKQSFIGRIQQRSNGVFIYPPQAQVGGPCLVFQKH